MSKTLNNKLLRFSLYLVLILLIARLMPILANYYDPFSTLVTGVLIAFGVAYVFHQLSTFICQKLKIKRQGLVTFFVLVGIIAYIVLLIIFVLPVFFKAIYDSIPIVMDMLNQISEWFYSVTNINLQITAEVNSWLNVILNNLNEILGITVTLTQFIASSVFVIIIWSLMFTFFLFDFPALSRLWHSFWKTRKDSRVKEYFSRSNEAMRKLSVAYVLVIMENSVVLVIGYSLLGIPGAVPLALLAGAISIIPYIGATIVGIFACTLAFSISPQLFVATLAFVIIQQNVDSHFIQPYILKQSFELRPIANLLVILTSVIVFGGLLGLLISFPIVVFVAIGFDMWKEKREIKELPVVKYE